MREFEIVNARIISTSFGLEDHGVMTFFINLEWRCCGQGLGGYCLDAGKSGTKERTGFGPGFIAIRKILETVGVDTWEKLPGTLVRLKVDALGSSRPPIIGHIMEEKWFDLKEFIEANKNG